MLVNVALMRPAVQSSAYGAGEASRAVDGNLTTESCTSFQSTEPWLSVDLGSPMDVGRVCVINDDNANYGQLCQTAKHFYRALRCIVRL